MSLFKLAYDGPYCRLIGFLNHSPQRWSTKPYVSHSVVYLSKTYALMHMIPHLGGQLCSLLLKLTKALKCICMRTPPHNPRASKSEEPLHILLLSLLPWQGVHIPYTCMHSWVCKFITNLWTLHKICILKPLAINPTASLSALNNAFLKAKCTSYLRSLSHLKPSGGGGAHNVVHKIPHKCTKGCLITWLTKYIYGMVIFHPAL